MMMIMRPFAFLSVIRETAAGEAVFSRLAAGRASLGVAMRNTRLVNAAFFWFIWSMVLMAALTTLALWATLDAKYGSGQTLIRHLREESSDSGLVDGLQQIFHKIEGVFSPSRTVDITEIGSNLGSVCPEIDIPGSDGNLTHRLNETTLFHAEEHVLGAHTVEARELSVVATRQVRKVVANALMRREIPKSPGSSAWSSAPPTIAETLNMGLQVRDYVLLPGGHWIPTTCAPRWKVAIIIPFRDRFYHLPILLRHLVPFLQSQHLEFAIFVVEQANELRFNRAMLMNVGFVEALNFMRFDCFIFHDVDHVPLSYGNYYGCGSMPRHFVSGVDRWKYRLLYNAFFGAVTGFTRSQIKAFNGFPNVYWGWGGEDDDILGRIRARGLVKTRPWGRVGFYNVISHHHKSAKKNMDRVCLLNHYRQRIDTDGLSNLRYGTPSIELHPLYTNISVDIQELAWNENWHVCDREAELAAQKHDDVADDVDVGKQGVASNEKT